jgi:hypothetical protein
VAGWGAYDFEDYTILLVLKYFLHPLGSHNNYGTKSKIFIITKLPPPHEKGERYEEG